jgi:argininosuccinate lyase
MTDYKFAFDSLGVFDSTKDMFGAMDAVLDALQVNPQRAREELENEWTTSMELADTLERTQKVPFRIGHSFASLIVEQARSEGLTPKTFPYADAQKLFTQAADKYQWKQNTLPLDEATFRAALSPENMVKTRKGTGGPQPEEVKRMLAEAHKTLDKDQAWLQERREKLTQAEGNLDRAFEKLLSSKGQ